ncbi:hypothetical protein H7F15_19280 [Pontibacter sp. Tf4]|uniref:hypothetical protein n=1 Tax=Pontibacter sp. Tf4 TaxID=2761620 RepID=UPI001625898F|nr:hypothetical protein [Pontibacter sp. Tf4]MBB6613186.1 hypothetical protein [Pontibacter sp. Tf4]
MKSDNSKKIIGVTTFVCGGILTILSEKELGLFYIVMFIGLITLLIGLVRKTIISDSKPVVSKSIKKSVSESVSGPTKLSLNISQSDSLVVIKIGEYYNIVDYVFFWDAIRNPSEQTSERKTIFEPDQCILDFSSNQSFDSYGYEFCQLVEQYKVIKGKKLAICGLPKKLEQVYFELDDKNYLEDAEVFDSLEEAMRFYMISN